MMTKATTTPRRDKISDHDKDTLATAIARELGQDWRAESQQDGRDIRRLLLDEGYGCLLWWSEYPAGRLEVRGVWPTTKAGETLYPDSYGESAPTITVSADRSAKAIAGEIIRRFLPAYLPLYQQKRARANGADAYAAQTAETRARVLAAAEGAGRESGRDLGTVFLRDNHAYSVTAQGDSVRFEAFSCPVDVAIQVLALLAKPAETQADDEEAGS